MLRTGLHCGPATRLFFLSNWTQNIFQTINLLRSLEDVQPLKKIVALGVRAIDQSIWHLEKASNFSTSNDSLFPFYENHSPWERLMLVLANPYQESGLWEMPAHAILTLDEHFSLPAGGKTGVLSGLMVDITSRLEQKNKCLQIRNYKMFLNAQNSF